MDEKKVKISVVKLLDVGKLKGGSSVCLKDSRYDR